MPRTSRLERAGTAKCLRLALENFGFKMAASLHLTAIEAIAPECVLRTGFAVRRDVYVSLMYLSLYVSLICAYVRITHTPAHTPYP